MSTSRSRIIAVSITGTEYSVDTPSKGKKFIKNQLGGKGQVIRIDGEQETVVYDML
jgi:hypothetical protein